MWKIANVFYLGVIIALWICKNKNKKVGPIIQKLDSFIFPMSLIAKLTLRGRP